MGRISHVEGVPSHDELSTCRDLIRLPCRCEERPDLLLKLEMSILPFDAADEPKSVLVARMSEAEHEWREITSMS